MGEMAMRVGQRVAFEDPGFVAYDLRDGELTQSVQVLGGPVDTSVLATYILVYSVCDAAGNCASQEREVVVYNPCPEGEQLCDDGSCSTANGVCGFVDTADVLDDGAAVVEEYIPPLDETPPVLTISAPTDGTATFAKTLSGRITVRQELTLFEAFSDVDGPYGGYVALDDVDGDVTSSVTVRSDSAIDTESPTEPGVPYRITYSVKDSSGNAAPEAVREITIVDPCASSGQVYCKADRQCHTDCVLAASSVAFDDSEGAVAEVAPLEISILGPGAPGRAAFVLPYGAAYDACSKGAASSTACDKGAEAFGGVAPLHKLRACGREFDAEGLAGCNIDVYAPGEYDVVFSIMDFAGTIVSEARRVHVRHTDETCPIGERACAGGLTCSIDGRCEGELDAAATADEEETVQDLPPVLTLVTSEFLTSPVRVRQFHHYKPCTADTDFLPTKDILCEPGAHAIDDIDGNLTQTVLACPPPDCIDSGLSGAADTLCQGHEFTRKGLQGCLNTSIADGVFVVPFVVKDNAIPPNVAMEPRIVSIVSPCDEGFVWCTDQSYDLGGFCSDVDCALRESLLASAGSAIEENAPPELYAVGPTESQVSYLAKSQRSLRVCGSAAAARSHLADASTTWPCAAFANDTQDGDLTADIQVRETTCDYVGQGEACFKCGIASFDVGNEVRCAPGSYFFQYSVVDAFGYPGGSLTLRIDIVEVAVASLTFDIASTAPTYEEAIAESAAISAEACQSGEATTNSTHSCAYAIAIRKLMASVAGVSVEDVAIAGVNLVPGTGEAAGTFIYKLSVEITTRTTRGAVATPVRRQGDGVQISGAVAASVEVGKRLSLATSEGSGFGDLLVEAADEVGVSVGAVGNPTQPTTAAVTQPVDANEAALVRLQADLDDLEASFEEHMEAVAESKALAGAAPGASELPALFSESQIAMQDGQSIINEKADELLVLGAALRASLENLTDTTAQRIIELESEIAERKRFLEETIGTQAESARRALPNSCNRNDNGQLRTLFKVDARNTESLRAEHASKELAPSEPPALTGESHHGAPPAPCEWHGNPKLLTYAFISRVAAAIGDSARRMFLPSIYPSGDLNDDLQSSHLINLRDSRGFQMSVLVYPSAGKTWAGLIDDRAGRQIAFEDEALHVIQRDFLPRARAAAVLSGAEIGADELSLLYVQFGESPLLAEARTETTLGANITTTSPPAIARAVVMSVYVDLTRASQSIAPCAPPPLANATNAGNHPLQRGRKLLSRQALDDAVLAESETNDTSTRQRNNSAYLRPRFLGEGDANRIVGGVLILAAQRKRTCGSGAKLGVRQDVRASSTQSCRSQDMDTQPFGSNPIFRRGSTLFSPKIVGSGFGPSFDAGVRLYYDANRTGSNKEVSTSGIPYAFFSRDTSGTFHYPVRNYHGGVPVYPVFVDVSLTGKASERIFEYMREGHYVNHKTDRLYTSLLVHNVRSNVFCRILYTFDQDDAGVVKLTDMSERCVPVVTYQSAWEVLVGFFEGVLTVALVALMARQARKAYGVYLDRMSVPKHAASSFRRAETVRLAKAIFMCSITAIQVCAIFMWWIYVFRFSLPFGYEARYQWYDGDATSRGRPLLTSRKGPAEDFDGINPAGSHRHLLAPDLSKGAVPFVDLHDMADATIELFSVYFFLQALSVVMLFGNIFVDMDFNRKFHVVIGTLAMMMPRVFVMFLIILFVSAGYAAWLFLSFGARNEAFSTYTESALQTSYIVLGETEGFEHFRLDPSVITSTWEDVSMQLWIFSFPIITSFLLLQFIFVIILDTYIELFDKERNSPGIVKDLWGIAALFFDVNVRRKVSNVKLRDAFKAMKKTTDKSMGLRKANRKWTNLMTDLLGEGAQLFKDVGAQQLQGVDEVRYASWPKDLNESKRALVRTQMMKHGKMRCIDTGLLSLGEDAVTGLLRRLHYELGRAGADRGNPVFQRESGSDSHLMRWTPASDSPVVRVAKESSPTFLVDSVMRRFGVEDKVTNVVNQIVKQGRSPIPLNAELDALNARERLHVARRVNRVMKTNLLGVLRTSDDVLDLHARIQRSADPSASLVLKSRLLELLGVSERTLASPRSLLSLPRAGAPRVEGFAW